MPKIVTAKGKVKNYAYTKKGKEAAKKAKSAIKKSKMRYT